MKRLMLLAGLTMISLFYSAEIRAAAGFPVAFDWFEYTGNNSVFADRLPKDFYRNPILAGFYPDPSVCRVGDDFYLINSSFAYFPGIPIFHSPDLINWIQIGHVIDRPSQLNYDGTGVSRGIFAPSISFHDGRFYVVCTHVDGGGNFFVTAADPAGPWSDPTWLPFEGIDPSFFFDDDGRAWLVNNGNPEGKPLYEGHRAIWLQEFDVKAQKPIGRRTVIVDGGVDLSKKPIWIEGPHLFKRRGAYYLSCAEGGTGDNHSEVIFRSGTVTGPFTPSDKNPILTQRDLPRERPNPVTCTGHAELFEGPDGKWWSVFLGCQPYQGGYYATGRETFLLPVTWSDDDWPLILAPGRSVPLVAPAPELPASARRSQQSITPLTGNFTWRDNFDQPSLALDWVMLGQPHETWWSLQNPAGHLSLLPRKERLSGSGKPSFLARRQQHAGFEASTELSVPSAAGVSAGLVAFQNETHHYYLGVRQTPEGATVFLERADGRSPEIIIRREVPAASTIALKIVVREASCSFHYAAKPGEWETLLSDADATLLTTQSAGGFVGAMVGVHARIE